MSYDLFVSHASVDKLFADALVHKLEENGLRCWYAPRDIEPGAAWPAAISRAIKNAPAMLLIFSASSNNSDEISRELALAADSHSLVVPVRIDNVEPDESLAYHLSGRHWLDVAGMDTESATSHVLESLRRYGGLAGRKRGRGARRPRALKLALAALLLLLLGAGAYWLCGQLGFFVPERPENAAYFKAGEKAALNIYSERGDSRLLLGVLRLAPLPGADGEDYLLAATGQGGPDDGVIYRCQLVLGEDDMRYVLDINSKRHILFSVDQLGRGRFISPAGGEARLVYFDQRQEDPVQSAIFIDDYLSGRKWKARY